MLSKRIINFGWQFSFFAESFLLKEILLKAQVVPNLPKILILSKAIHNLVKAWD